jgi:dATP pyrophosphohydrolase
MRAPFQILVIPFVKKDGAYLYCLFKRKDMNIWQAIAGGGEDEESPIETARRESFEEARIDKESNFIELSSFNTIPAVNIHGLLWGNDIVMIPEICFGVEVISESIKLSKEHNEFQWLSYDEAISKLKYDSNKSAIWELDYRLKNNLIGSDSINNSRQNINKYYNK